MGLVGRVGGRGRGHVFAVDVFPSSRARRQRSERAAQINNKAWDGRRETMYYCASTVVVVVDIIFDWDEVDWMLMKGQAVGQIL